MRCRLLFALCLPLTLLACQPPPAAPPAGPRVVKLITVGADGTEQRGYSGEIRARHETVLAFRIGGKLMAREVDAGARVEAGRVLARLDPADAALEAGQAAAQQQLAEAEARRYRELRERNFVSQAALDARETGLAASRAQADLARNRQAYASLRADRAGVVLAVLAEPGQVLGAGQGVLRMAWDGEREVAFSVPEAHLAGLKIGAEAEITLWAEPGRRYRGRLRELAPANDPQHRGYSARVTLLDPAPPALGMTAEVRIAGPARTAPRVPLSALIQQADGHAVWLVGADSSVSRRAVKVRALTDAGALIAEGLDAGERIVAAGVQLLNDGDKVHPLEGPQR